MAEPPAKQVRERPGIGVGVMVWKGDLLLLGKRINAHGEGTWQFPGGHLEVHETVTACAAREVFEETGLVVRDVQHAAYTDRVYTAGARHYVTLFVTASYVSGEPGVMEPDKCQCWQWFHYEELPSPLFAPITGLLEQVPGLVVFRTGRDIPASAHK